jgi:hypothetical protein
MWVGYQAFFNRQKKNNHVKHHFVEFRWCIILIHDGQIEKQVEQIGKNWETSLLCLELTVSLEMY